MGLLGAIAFWSLLGIAIITGCRLVRSRNREVALFGALLACALVGYALEGYNDQGFFMYRIAFVIGTLLGLGEAARRLDARGAKLIPAVAATPLAAPPPRRFSLVPSRPAPAERQAPRAEVAPRRRRRRDRRSARCLSPYCRSRSPSSFGSWSRAAGAAATMPAERSRLSRLSWKALSMTDPVASLSTIERREPHWEEAASSAEASSRRLRVFAIRVINYVTNHIVCHIPSFAFRRFWYSRVLGVRFGERAGVHLGCYFWFYGPGQVRRDGVSIGANSRINRDCSIDVRGGVKIGDNVSISPEVVISTAAHSAVRPEVQGRAPSGRDRGPGLDRDAGDDPRRRDARPRLGGGGRSRGHEGCPAADDRRRHPRAPRRDTTRGGDALRDRRRVPALRVSQRRGPCVLADFRP